MFEYKLDAWFDSKLHSLGLKLWNLIVDVSSVVLIMIIIYAGLCLMFDLGNGKTYKKAYFVFCIYLIIRLIDTVVVN